MVIRWHFDDFKPTHSGVDHCHSGETNIILNDSSVCMLLYYRLNIQTYQVHMHRIPQFQFCNILGFQTSIQNHSLFELLTYIAQLIMQICLDDKAFPVAHLSVFFRISTANWVVQIEMLPIQYTSAQSLWCVYFAIVADYFYSTESLFGVTGYPMRNVCNDFGIYFSQVLLLFSFRIQYIQWEIILIVFLCTNCE